MDILLFCLLLAIGIASVVAEDTTSIPESLLTLTGPAVSTVPTGSYKTYLSTLTVTPSPISTATVISTIADDTTTRTTIVRTTTILGIGTNAENVTSEIISTETQTLLTGRPSTTANSTNNSISSSLAPIPTNQTPCNNYPEFCSRKYSNITEVSAHNSPFIRAGNAGANQALSVTAQLNDGIRLLQVQIRFINEKPHLCHTSCQVLDAGPMTDYLGDVLNWVSSHPYDIVSILLGNGDYRPVTQIAPYVEDSGLVPYAYIPPKVPMMREDWPTLSSMILTGKRVIFFMDYEANQTAVPWIMDQFSQMWETPFSPTDRAFPCTVERPPGLLPQDAPQRMYIMNHNLNYEISILGNSLLVPNIPLLNVTNNVTGFGSVGENAQNCNDTWHYPPKFLNVDYYNVGNGTVFQVAAKFNNVTYDRECCGRVQNAASNLSLSNSSSLLLLLLITFGYFWSTSI
ncbi:putative secreted protein [Erysiphe neolycopersici]|uniref:Putative secreted protein n=1 Tax=Erysiphe neolycopersici TaxID=212602 RepID=A0A420I2Q1_9PEZI|nr:putative secreted protein [Erysiphe neolycopersici]